MTVSSTVNTSPIYAGNDTTGPWAFSFKTFDQAELEVVKADSDGVETILTLTADYTVSLNGDQNASPGGEVTTVANVATGESLRVRWAGAPTQGTDIQNAGGFYPEVIENALDKLTMLLQKLAEEVSRALRVSLTAGESVETEIGGAPSLRANRYLGFDAAGDLTLSSSFDAGALTVSAFAETLLDDTTAATARTTLGAASTGANTFTGLQTFAASADIASAATVDLTAAGGNTTRITGTTATSAFTMAAGQWHLCIADGAWPLTYHATTNKLNTGGANYTCAAGDSILLHKDNSNIVQVTIFPVSGQAVVAATSSFPSGTKMLFQQTAAPTGWTKDTTHNDKALRVVSGAVSTGGSSAFSTVFGKTAADGHTLTTAQIPSQTHQTYGFTTGTATGPDAGGDFRPTGSNGATLNWASVASYIRDTNSGGSHAHNMDIRVQYVDLIIATKD